MDLFGIGFGEILLILIVALMIFGPGKLPEIARTIGRFSRNLKKMSSDFTSAMAKEIDMEEEQKNLKKMSTDLKADLTAGLSLQDPPNVHLDPNKVQPPQIPSAATPAEAKSSASEPAIPSALKHD